MQTITLVTGGAGFIGSHVVERLLAEGHVVRILDDLSTGDLSNLRDSSDKVQVIKGSILDKELVRGAVAGCQNVIHLAALTSVPGSIERPSEYMEVNVVGSANVLAAAKDAGVRRVVMASSAAVYGNEVEAPMTESNVSAHRCSPYAVSKYAMEDLGKDFSKRGLNCISLRLFNVFGPRQRADSGYAAAIPAFMDACKKGKNPTIHGDGNQTRDFTYVGNVAEAFVRAATLPGIGGVYNIGSGRTITINELCSAIIKTSGASVSATHEAERAGDLKNSSADISRAFKHLGLRESQPITEGLKTTWDWFSGQRI